jgi:hypothetical protein
MSAETFDGHRFVRMRHIRKLQDEGRLDSSLRWQVAAAVGAHLGEEGGVR